MADNVTLPGTGASISSDDVGGVQYQRVKIDLGGDGAASPLLRGQQTGANSIPAVLASDDPAVTSLAILDDWDESDRAKVNPIVGQAGVAAGAGAVGATVQRVTLASDDPLVAIIRAEDAATADGHSGMPVMTMRQDTPANTSGTDGDYEILKQSAGRLWVSSPPIAASSIAKAEDAAHADGDAGVPALAVRTDTPTNRSGTDGDYEPLQVSAGKLWTKPVGSFVTCSTDITRPADTTAYTANDALSNSTSAPTSGGFTFTSAARISGGSGIITDVIVGSSNPAATALQGEVWIFDTSVTNINDNAAFAISDTEVKTLVGVIAFTMETGTNNNWAQVRNLSLGFTCVGSANLRFLVKVKNAYTPASSEVITVRAKILQID